ncbi:MAG TPA: hypothetical protein DCQ64_23050 [Candidatus Rokubacteria bacterium]|nr:hypothetical protein [Candidatus Rokubacteria bacterium]
MKFTQRSFAGPGEYIDAESIGDEIRFVLLWSTGPDEEETVGEASHHSELEGLARWVVEGEARSANFLAWLKREPDNPHDPKAVAIVALLEDQMPETVSYLPRPVARQYGPLLAEIDEKTGREVVCRGRLIVPKEDHHHYSVVLRLSPSLLDEFLAWTALPEDAKDEATRAAWKRRKKPPI